LMVSLSNHEMDRSASIFDYMARAKDARVIVSEFDEVEANAIKLVDQIHASYRSVTGADEDGAEDRRRKAAPPDVLPPSELIADWDQIAGRLAQATRLAELGLDDDRRSVSTDSLLEALPAHAIRCQPTL